MKGRIALAAALAVGVSGIAAAAPHGTSTVHKFAYSGAGTNRVNVQTGEVREIWKGRSKALGKITAHVAGWIQRPNQTDLVFHGSMVIVDRSDDVLIAACSGKGILPNPHGSEDWICDATGGTGKFKHSSGRWTLHIVIDRVSIKNGIQKNRFTEKGRGRVSWAAPKA